jgi:Antibiotic biosynthesis monooxygenase
VRRTTIARIAYFGHLTPEQEAASLHNLRERFKAVISSQDGYVAGYWLRRPDGRLISLSVWQSEEHLRAGGMRAHAVPLLPGQVAELIPEAEHVEICQVVDQAKSMRP